jgi:hypothetical protein
VDTGVSVRLQSVGFLAVTRLPWQPKEPLPILSLHLGAALLVFSAVYVMESRAAMAG